MPVSHDALVFPYLFTTNKRLYLPFLLLDAELAPIRENRSLGEEGMLCFTLKLDLNSSRFSDGWFDGQRIYGKQTQKQINNITTVTQNFTTNAVWFNGSWPWTNYFNSSNSTPPTQPKWAPSCWGTYKGESWPWTGCQSRRVRWADRIIKFTFSPDVVGPDRYVQGFFQQEDIVNSFNTWLLCGVNGSCLDASPLIMISDGSFGEGNFSCVSIHSQSGFGEDASPLLM